MIDVKRNIFNGQRFRCDPARPSPFTKHLTRARQSADSVLRALQGVMKLADKHYPGEMVHPSLDHVTASVNQSLRTLGEVSALLECRRPHQDFSVIVHHTCNTTVNGVVYLLFSAKGSAILFTVLVWLASHTWIYLNSKNGRLHQHHPHSGTHKSEGGMNGGNSGGGSHHHHHHHHHTATMPRDSHSHHQGPPIGPNQGQYATLSKQCKTLESSDFY
ncbi:Tweety [Trinorchestia longiramus]|nr:Tweety [Trinorchestia longiramus]